MNSPAPYRINPRRFYSLPTRREIWLLACAALGYWLAFPNPMVQIPPAALLMPGVIMLFSLENEHPRRALALSFFSMMAGCSLCLYWLAIPMHDFAGVPWFIGACFVLLLGVYFGLYGLLFSLALRLLLRPGRRARTGQITLACPAGDSSPADLACQPDRNGRTTPSRFRQRAVLLIRLAAAALIWGALENLRGFIFTGFPWLGLSTAFVGWPLLAQGSALFGMYALSALYVFAALLLFAALPGAGTLISNTCATPKSACATPENACASTKNACATPENACALCPKPKATLINWLAGNAMFFCLAVLLLALLAAYGQSRLTRDWEGAGRPVLIGLVQGNVDQMQKWSLEKRSFTVRRYLDLSALAVEKSWREYDQKPDLLIWPETSLPFPFQLSPELARPVRDFAAREAVPLLFGAQGRTYATEKSRAADGKNSVAGLSRAADKNSIASPSRAADGSNASGNSSFAGVRSAADSQDRAYNRVWLLDESGQNQGSYDKEHLVPFGEYLPPGLYVPFASEFLQGTGFTPGTPTMELPAGMRYKHFALGLLICYEVIFPELAQARVAQGANLLVSVSNDAWFGRSAAAYQHLQQAAQRCIEQGRYLVRATNTGVSAAIDPAGRIRHPSALFTPASQVERVSLLEETTFYHRHAGVIGLLLWLLPALVLTERLAGHFLRTKI